MSVWPLREALWRPDSWSLYVIMSLSRTLSGICWGERAKGSSRNTEWKQVTWYYTSVIHTKPTLCLTIGLISPVLYWVLVAHNRFASKNHFHLKPSPIRLGWACRGVQLSRVPVWISPVLVSANPDTVSQTREGRDSSSSPDMSNPLSLLFPNLFLSQTLSGRDRRDIDSRTTQTFSQGRPCFQPPPTTTTTTS